MPMDSALHLPFALLLAPSGRITLLSAPVFPPEIAKRTDLSHEFEDFFVSLPDSALRPERRWPTRCRIPWPVAPKTLISPAYSSVPCAQGYRCGSTNAVVIGVEQTITIRSRAQWKANRLPSAPSLRAGAGNCGVRAVGRPHAVPSASRASEGSRCYRGRAVDW